MSAQSSNAPPSLPPGVNPLPEGSELERAFSESIDESAIETVQDHAEEHVKRRKRVPLKEHTIKELNLTAMMDMMTIILVFLLKNYATQPENVTLSEKLQPPKSITDVKLEAALPVTITKDGILVDNKDIGVSVQAGKVMGEPANYTGTIIQPLKDKLDEKVAQLEKIQQGGGQKFEGKVLIICDGDVPYALLMRVLYTAGQADFTQYKLVTRARAPGEAVGAP